MAVTFASKAQTVTITSSASGTVCSGTSVTFTASVTSISSPTYQWYKNGTTISGETNSTYTTNALSNNDQIHIKATPAIVSATTVTSNLMAHLDAGNSSSYNGTGNTWTDLTGNGNKITLSNTGYSTVNGGGIALNTNGYGTQTLASSPFNGDFTWSTIFKYNDNNWNWIYNVGGYTGMVLTAIGKPALSWGGWFNNKIDGSAESSLTNGNYYMLTFVRSGNAISCYLQATPFGAGSSVSGNISLVSPTIGKGPGGEAWQNGIVNLILLYNRALTQSEITQNFNTYASRFGFSAASISSNTITATIAATPSSSVTVSGDACANKTTLTTASGSPSYTWYKDNSVVPGATSNVYTPSVAGDYKVEVTSGSCSSTSTSTTIYTCGTGADGRTGPISSAGAIISPEGGANFGTGRDITGKIYNTTSLTTTSGTIGSTTAVLGGVISATNAVTSSIGVLYSTASNFGTYSTASIGSNVATGTFTSTITGLTASTTYYAKSFIVNGAGTSYGDVVSFTTAAPPVAVGDIYAGGLVYYILKSGDNGYDANIQHGLIVQPQNEIDGLSSNPPYAGDTWTRLALNTNVIAGAQNDGTLVGKANTAAIIANQGAGTYLYKYVSTLTINGYSDWYVPSIKELNLFRAFLYNSTYCSNTSTTHYYWASIKYPSYKYSWGNYYSSTQSGANYTANYLEGNGVNTQTYNQTQSGSNNEYVAIRSF
jgi:hypothetical protein